MLAKVTDDDAVQSDHEKHTRRSQEVEEAAQQSAHSGRGSAAGPGPSSLNTDAARLYQSRDLSLKDGETIKIKMPGSSGASRIQQRAQGLPTVSLPPPQQPRAPMPAPTQAPPQVFSWLCLWEALRLEQLKIGCHASTKSCCEARASIGIVDFIG